jgi:hypothetical protein
MTTTNKKVNVAKLFVSNALIIGPYIALVTSSSEYLKVLNHLDIEVSDLWLAGDANACVHKLYSPISGLCCIVCVRDFTDKAMTYEQICGTLCHEAVHVFQLYCSNIGECDPSIEFEAYSIESVFTQLLIAYRIKYPKLFLSICT